MARLPQPGGDDNTWGSILNQFLAESHASDGTLKPNVVGAGQIQDGVIGAAKINAAGAADGKALTYGAGGLSWTDKEPAITAGTASQFLRGDKTWQNLTKSTVGLANVDNTADSAKPLSTAASNALDGKASFVLVTTGSEARPSGPFCIWAGGSIQPTNMGASDLWFAASIPADTTPPSVPTGLASSAVQATSFTVTWTASSGSPTLYQVYLNGSSAGTTSTTSLTVTGKTAATTYSVTVSARDAAGNWSAQSAALSVTTAAAGLAVEHTTYASSVPASLSYFNDGGSGLWFGNQFYTVGAAAETWKIVGGRFYVPAGVSALVGKKMALRLVIKPQNTTTDQPDTNLNINTDMSEQQIITLGSGWNEVRWSSAYDFDSSKGSRIFIAGRILAGADPAVASGEYLYSSVAGGTAALQATDGSALYRAAAAQDVGWNSVANGYVTNAYYGLDVILAES